MAKKETGSQLKEKTNKQTAQANQANRASKSYKSKSSGTVKQNKNAVKGTKEAEKNNHSEKKSQDLMFDVVSRFKETLKLMDLGENSTKSKSSKSKAQAENKKSADKKVDKKSKAPQSLSKKTPAAPKAKLPTGKLKIFSLGGLHEVGKNITVLEYENDIIIVDCGLGFPDDDMPGVDLVIPDISYLEANSEKIRGVLLTHGHEDHIGAIPYLLRSINPPIFGTNLTLGIIKNKLSEHQLSQTPKLNCVKAGDTVRLGPFTVEFIHVNHSIADACALAIRTPLGTVVHTGDFKLDVTPIDGEIMNLTRLGKGNLQLMHT